VGFGAGSMAWAEGNAANDCVGVSGLDRVHILDKPVWAALTGRQTGFALGEGPVRRFAVEIGPLSGCVDQTDASLAAFGRLECGEDGLWLLEAQEVAAPAGMAVKLRAACVQMVAREILGAEGCGFEVCSLGEADAAEMLELALLTKPGPFAIGTHRLGEFIGVRVGGKLVAMAGERMRPVGYCEVSGVCTHPDFRGKGHASGLMRIVARRILARGERPFLHSYSNNLGAIGLYESLGFVKRREVHLTVLGGG